jgi:hypothetical protein
MLLLLLFRGHLSQGRAIPGAKQRLSPGIRQCQHLLARGCLSQVMTYTWSSQCSCLFYFEAICPKGESIPGAKQRLSLMSPGSSQCQPLLALGHLSQWEDLYLEPSKDCV